MANSEVSHSIKHRKTANDVVLTPRPVARKHIEKVIDMVCPITSYDYDNDFVLFDPCRHSENGAYYSQYPYPEDKCDWCEITEGRDFMDYTPNYGERLVAIFNPPYSILDKWIDNCIRVNCYCISMLIGIHNLTPRRIEKLENAGYYLADMEMLKIYEYYGMSVIITFLPAKGNSKSIIDYDRKVYRKGEEDK